ncbi:hypothetical protein CERZMDRAFT_85235 [Cercospora zeae-maydis SCOH1-5]|uniref:Uncharacterized protein n=1 Tax=Cercospora zeae-maydis SCOH1-5 TaxID=717836 RepID=A0A6A6FDI7_9PEZI|nr:hypothetical protein CERZMDRAFT_85235 [Cercospora zeae-maydis SCOH1-5]
MKSTSMTTTLAFAICLPAALCGTPKVCIWNGSSQNSDCPDGSRAFCAYEGNAGSEKKDLHCRDNFPDQYRFYGWPSDLGSCYVNDGSGSGTNNGRWACAA